MMPPLLVAMMLAAPVQAISGERSLVSKRHGRRLQKLLPAVPLMPGAVGAPFGVGWPVGGFVMVAIEGDACGEPVRLPVAGGPPQKIVVRPPRWPDGIAVPPAGDVVQVRRAVLRSHRDDRERDLQQEVSAR